MTQRHLYTFSLRCLFVFGCMCLIEIIRGYIGKGLDLRSDWSYSGSCSLLQVHFPSTSAPRLGTYRRSTSRTWWVISLCFCRALTYLKCESPPPPPPPPPFLWDPVRHERQIGGQILELKWKLKWLSWTCNRMRTRQARCYVWRHSL